MNYDQSDMIKQREAENQQWVFDHGGDQCPTLDDILEDAYRRSGYKKPRGPKRGLRIQEKEK